MANPNNGDSDKNLVPFRQPEPVTGLGQIVFTLDIDAVSLNIGFTNQSTMQLTNPQELGGIIAPMVLRLFCEELKRRSKSTIIT